MLLKIEKILEKLLYEHKTSESSNWQSVGIDKKNPLVEIRNVYLQLKSSSILVDKNAFNEDKPWAEDHFLERINGQPINPGEQYKNWPYYNNGESFMHDGKFSHNYMERYWCKGYTGIRYEYGDLNDIIERIKSDNYTRQAFLSVWHPEDQSNNNVRVPCTIGYWFNYFNNQLNVTYLIRSCDAVRHFRNDLYLTYRLLEHVSEQCGLIPGDMDIWIGSLHCFKSDLYTIKKKILCVDSL